MTSSSSEVSPGRLVPFSQRGILKLYPPARCLAAHPGATTKAAAVAGVADAAEACVGPGALGPAGQGHLGPLGAR